jgi:hypothetical protein
MNEKGGTVNTFLWVEQIVCNHLAKNRFYVDLLELKRQTGAEKALFTAFTSREHEEKEKLHSAISPDYRVENCFYDEKLGARDNAIMQSYVASALVMNAWVANAPIENRVKIVLVAHSDCFAAVVREFAECADIEVYTDNPRIVMAMVQSKFENKYACHDYWSLPQRFVQPRREAQG